MDRLTLLRRPKTAEREQCLPAGDSLPSWSSLPLDTKFPMVPNPKGSVVFCTTNLCDSKHKSSRNFDFDLTDPYCHLISNEYHPLHDRHLRNHFNLPRMRRHLMKKGFITQDGKVICNLKEFNCYRQYLRKICLMELARENKLQEKERALAAQNETDNVEESATDYRIRKVRERLAEQRATTRQRIEEVLQQKAERIQQRVDDLHTVNMKREIKRQEEERRRQATLEQHHEEIQRRNRNILRRYRYRERQHIRRLEEKRRQRILDQQKKNSEAWEARKKQQRERIQRECKFLQEEQDRREKSITARENLFNEQRDKIRIKLENLKKKTNQERQEREERHAKRLAHRLALAEIRAWSKRRGKRRLSRNSRFRSLWTLEETLRRLTIPDSAFGYRKPSSNFLSMLNDAMNEVVIVFDDEEHIRYEGKDVEEDLQKKAKIIVDSVIHKVKTDVWPQYLETLQEGWSEDRKEKSVQFGGEEIHCTSYRASVDVKRLRPAREHVLTPVASPIAMSDIPMEDEEEEDKKLVEKLLNRLLDDVNKGNLCRDDLVKLTSFSMEIISSQPAEDGLAGFESGDLYETAAADDLVRFTLEKILSDIRTGKINQTELTDLTVSVLEAEKVTRDRYDEKSSSSNDDDVSLLVDETLQHIMSDESIDKDSPVYDYMVDEFIVKTLAEISDDLEHGRLSNDMIMQMLSVISEEIEDSPDEKHSDIKLRSLLDKILRDLETGGTDTLYKVVHVIVTSYHDYKDTSAQSLSELLTTIVEKISFCVSSGQLQESEIDLETLCDVAINISSSLYTSAQMHSIASQLALALSLDQQPERYETGLFVEKVVHDAKAKLVLTDASKLKDLASVVTSCHTAIAERNVATSDHFTDELSQPFLSDVSHFIVDILKLVWKTLDKGFFSEMEVAEMSEIFRKVGRKSSQKSTPYEERKQMLLSAVEELLGDVENNRIEREELDGLGEHLLHCGRKLLGTSPPSSLFSSKTSSFTSTAIAEDVVTHVLASIQRNIDKGTVSKESLKEFAVCIFKHMEMDDKNDVLYVSPCESTLAEDIVMATIEDITRDLNAGSVRPETLSSIAVSAVSLLSSDIEEFDKSRMKRVMKKVIQCLKKDTIDRREAKKIFHVILESYENDWNVVFTSTNIPLTSDSQLAETLIRDTLLKIDRDLKSGAISDDELVTLADSLYEDENKIRPETYEDVVNLTLAVIQETLTSISMDTVTENTVKEFLALFDPCIPDSEYDSVEKIKQRLRKVGMEILRHRRASVYISNIMQCFATKDRTIDESDPIGILQRVLQIVKSDTLSHFIRVTLQTILTDMRYHPKVTKKRPLSGVTETDLAFHSATSLIANNVVRNLIKRVETTLLHGGTLASDEELLPVDVKSTEDEQSFKTVRAGEVGILSAYSSKELGNLILETLNNVVSNLRLERDIFPHEYENAQDDLGGRVSSHLIQDFVLEKLQNIVESMQDQISFEMSYDTGAIPVSRDQNEQVGRRASLMSMDDKQATAYIADVLRDVVNEMSNDVSMSVQLSRGSMLEKQTSTLTLEAETVVLSTLQDIIKMFAENKTKMKVLSVLEDIRKEIISENKSHFKEAVTDLINASNPSRNFSIHDSDNQQNKEVIGSDNLVERTIDKIISHVEADKIKVFYKVGSSDSDILVTLTNDESVDDFQDEDMEDEIYCTDRPALDLQKMLDMTLKMLKLHGKIRGGSSLIAVDELKRMAVKNQTSESIVDIVKETFDQTIENVKGGRLSDEEIVSLASALSQSRVDSEIRHRLSSTSNDDSIENFIVGVLEDIKRDIETEGLSAESLHSITDRLVELGKQQNVSSDVSKTRSLDSVSSNSSERLTLWVKNVVTKIANTLSDTSNTEDQIQTVKHSGSSDTQNSGSGSISKRNVNPNAAERGTSATSSDSTPSDTTSQIRRVSKTQTRNVADKPTTNKIKHKTSPSKQSCRNKSPTLEVSSIDHRRSKHIIKSEHSSHSKKSQRSLDHRSVRQSSKSPKKPIVICADVNKPIGNSLQQSKAVPNGNRTNNPQENDKKLAKGKRCSSTVSTKVKQQLSPIKSKSPRRVHKSEMKLDHFSSDFEHFEKNADADFEVMTNTTAWPAKGKKTIVIPQEVASLCGSHRTKVHVRVINDADN